MATRFYLPSSGAAPISLSGAATTWSGQASTWAARKAVTAKTNTALTDVACANPLGASRIDVDFVNRSFVSDPVSAQTISGTFSAVLSGFEGTTSQDAFVDIHIAVLVGDTSTVRGVLYAGSHQTASSATVGAENEEMSLTPGTSRIKNARTLTSVTAQDGDRILIEIGIQFGSALSGASGTLTYGDPTATADYSLTSGQSRTAGDPWVELSADVFVTTKDVTTSGPVGSAATVSAPTVTSSLAVTPDLITRAPSVSAPTVTPGALTVTPPTAGAAGTAQAPTVTPGAVTVTPNTVGSPATTVAPSATPGALTTTPSGPVGGPASLLGVTVDIGPPTVRPELVGSPATALAPTVTAGPIDVGPSALVRTPSVASPTVTPTLDVTPDPIARTAELLEPTVVGGPTTVSPDLVGGPAVLFAPRVKDSGDVVSAYVGPDPLALESWDPREPKKWNGSAWVKAPVHVID